MRWWTRHCRLAWIAVLATSIALLAAGRSHACVGVACMQIWSTSAGGGSLTVQWDFAAEKVRTYLAFCAPSPSPCLYSTIDPGFISPEQDVPGDGYYPLADGTTVRIEILSADSGLAINLNGRRLSAAGDSAKVGTMPDIHGHPSWQLLLPADEFGDYRITYKLTTDSPLYSESQPFTVTVTNAEPTLNLATPTATPVPTATPPPCWGDCNDDRRVTSAELVHSVRIAAEVADPRTCPVDGDGSGAVTDDELAVVVTAIFRDCRGLPRVTFEEIQALIFTPTCATRSCHDAQSTTGNLVLEAGASFDELVGVPPDVLAARNAGMLLVDPGHPGNSFLLTKLLGPPLGQGGRMPLVGDPLDADRIDLVRRWILEGARLPVFGFVRPRSIAAEH